MKRDSVLCIDSRGFHRMRYYEWGERDNPRIVLCVHGLTRSGRDFDYLAQSLSADFRVICPDVAGRGESDWLRAKTDYGYPLYLADLTTLIARATGGDGITEKRVYWVGTSMGALAGMMMAAMAANPITKLVANDAGMTVPKAALVRIAAYVGKPWKFGTYAELEAHVRRAYAPFGALGDEQWRHLTTTSSRQLEDGSWINAYDPAIGRAFEGELTDVDLSACWDAITCPTLLLRGAHSDVLPREVATAMTQRGPKARLVEIADTGHAPMLLDDTQVSIVRSFLEES